MNATSESNQSQNMTTYTIHYQGRRGNYPVKRYECASLDECITKIAEYFDKKRSVKWGEQIIAYKEKHAAVWIEGAERICVGTVARGTKKRDANFLTFWDATTKEYYSLGEIGSKLMHVEEHWRKNAPVCETEPMPGHEEEHADEDGCEGGCDCEGECGCKCKGEVRFVPRTQIDCNNYGMGLSEDKFVLILNGTGKDKDKFARMNLSGIEAVRLATFILDYVRDH